MIEALHGEDESHWAGRDAEVPPRRQTVDAQAISAAALSLFAERGYRATTMSDIGAAFGIRGPSPYRHVSSKQALLGEIMIETMRALIARPARGTGRRRRRDPATAADGRCACALPRGTP
ncbi:TetR/AcrR family transcriptional regulator [Streptomyces aurantiogriseus]|uniref:HTH tetR-type domain-containing protein n=1 Tax=Streptomyces aurantiogriseus TaxID=66870 RepID=A0A918FNF6_9ACTN|nr:helix-turn-helix domain-containing protein [Streptomyces aurantiogriseus]GGR59345.1 hypothetical protein GCM10010251_90190 [Streptomyces aurantiogriseus]